MTLELVAVLPRTPAPHHQPARFVARLAPTSAARVEWSRSGAGTARTNLACQGSGEWGRVPVLVPLRDFATA